MHGKFEFMELPNDILILFSFINTKLRDEYPSLDELCASLDINRSELEERLRTEGFVYDARLNKFR